MGDRLSSMLLFVVLLFLAFVESLPLSDKEYGAIRRDENQESKGNEKMESGIILDYKDRENKEIVKGIWKGDGEEEWNSETDAKSISRDFYNNKQTAYSNTQIINKKKKLKSSLVDYKNKDLIFEGIFNPIQNGSEYFYSRTHRHKRFSDWGDMHNKITPNMSPDVLNPFHNTHLVPCSHADRYFCLNGGICVLVKALDIKTCRYVIYYDLSFVLFGFVYNVSLCFYAQYCFYFIFTIGFRTNQLFRFFYIVTFVLCHELIF